MFFEEFGVFRLVVAGELGVWHDDGGFGSGGEFGNAGGASASDNDVGSAEVFCVVWGCEEGVEVEVGREA